MAILAFDIGGSSVKYGLWQENELQQQGSIKLPENWNRMQAELKQLFEQMNEAQIIEGVAFSAPGLVNEEIGEINGVSAVQYLHDFPVIKAFEQLFGVPVTMENDANCAALAEMWLGAAKNSEHAVFFVIGTGIGGALMINRQLFKGKNLFGGEFGYMFLNDSASLSDLGSSVKAVEKYNFLTNQSLSGQAFFKRADEGDLLANELATKFYHSVAMGIYNLLVCLDPGLVVLGGGVSANPNVVKKIKEQLTGILLERSVHTMNFELRACEFGNDANLIGAIYHHLDRLDPY